MFNNVNVAELLSKICLSDVLKLFLTLEKRENKFFSLCPFHNEQTPSLLINDNNQKRGFYYCFGCKKSGDAITFLMEYKGIGFNDAIKFLMKFNSIPVKAIDGNQSKISDKSKFFLLEKVASFYCKNLKENLLKNQILVNFLIERGLTIEMIDVFQLGFSSDSWDGILKEFINKHDRMYLIELGLLIKKNNVIYDRFRNRIIFPIKNLDNNIIGFGGRILSNNIKPKYINSPESDIFIKRNELYGLCKINQDNVHRSIIIVEGYLDVISLYKCGITNVVSSLGTSFSYEQFNLLKKKYKKIIFCYDGDEAGQTASFKIAIKLLHNLSENFYIGFIILPPGYDPDLLIRSHQEHVFLDLLAHPIFILDFILIYLMKDIDINLIEKKIDLFYNLTNISSTIEDKNLKQLIMNYFNEQILKYDKKNNKNDKKINDVYVLSLAMKGCIFLLKKRSLVKLLKDKDIMFLQENCAHSRLFLTLINILKHDINAIIPLELKLQINTVNNLSLIIDNMTDEIIESEFMAIIEKLEHII